VRSRRTIVALAAVAVLAGVALTLWGASSSHPGTPEPAEAAAANPNVSLVARGGQFLTSCPFTHTLPDDPIVHMNMPGMSHQHDFYGNVSTNAESTFDSLVKAPSSCDDVGDHSGYWTPALFVNGQRVMPQRADAYYRVGPGIDAADVVPFPNGLKVLAGNQVSKVPQSLDIVAWTCGMSPELHDAPPSGCGPDNPVNERLTFPDCWNGRQLDSADHVSHLAYSTASGCPKDHPVPIPQLTLVIHYPVSGQITSAHLASGPTTTAHGDFFEAWSPQRIQAQVAGCINRGVTCSIVGGTFHTGQGSRDLDEYNHPQPY
jgi:hypothetical protein